jgi:hypothetical protein
MLPFVPLWHLLLLLWQRLLLLLPQRRAVNRDENRPI